MKIFQIQRKTLPLYKSTFVSFRFASDTFDIFHCVFYLLGQFFLHIR